MDKKKVELLIKHLPSYGPLFDTMGLRMRRMNGVTYSIWGVMCDIARRAGKVGDWEVNPKLLEHKFVVASGPWIVSLPNEVREWYGFDGGFVDRLLHLEYNNPKMEDLIAFLERELKKIP